MYYNNIYFHNVNLMKKDENGHYLLSRFREDVLINAIPEKQTQKDDSGFNLYEAANTYNYSQYNSFVTEKSVLDPFKAFEGLSLGAELRFKLVSDVVKIKLKLLNGQNPALCEVFFGNFFAGKDYCLTITDYNVIEIELKKCNIPNPERINLKKKEVTFTNNVVRIILPSRNVLFVGVEGQTEIPQAYEMPVKNVVFLGSNGLGANDVDRPSNSIAFSVASKLNANCYNLSNNFTAKASKKLLPIISKYGKSCIFISDALTNEINDTNYKLQLRFIKQRIKLLSKFKKRAFFIDYVFNYFNFKKEKRALKIRAKIAKMLRRRNTISPYESYSNCMLFGVKELPAFAVGKITLDLVECISENFATFEKKQKLSTKYVYYSIKTAEDEPTVKPKVMKRSEKRKYLRQLKLQLKASRRNKKAN